MSQAQVDTFLLEGCGRCPNYRTPDCKVIMRQDVLITLREIVKKCDLREEYKWSQPCYTYEGKNVLILSALKDYFFFKGSLLEAPDSLLYKPGSNSQAARQLRFTTVEEVVDQEELIIKHIKAAILLEKQGKKVQFKKTPEPLPVELQEAFDESPALMQAFIHSLRVGKEDIFCISLSRNSQKTRKARIARHTPNILNGWGIHDLYNKNK